jgi:hypothetical protein
VNQELPIFCLVKADVCSSTIALSHSSLSFGNVYVSQQKTLQLAAKNLSLLPQKLAFTNLKKEIQIQPNDGFVVLLPNEEIQFNISFRPNSALSYHLPLTLSTSFNDQYHLQVLGNGIESIFSFLSPVIHLRPTIPGERVIESTVIQNNTKSRQILEMITPHSSFSWLKISPTVITLEPHGTARIEIEFFPPSEIYEEENPMAWHERKKEEMGTKVIMTPFQHWYQEDGWVYATGPYGNLQWKQKNWKPEEGGEGGEGGEGVIPPGVGDDEWGVMGQYHLPVYAKPLTMGAITPENIAEMSSLLPSPYYFCLETLVTKPEFVADINFVDYGQIAIGIRTIKTVKIRNLSLTRPMTIHTKGLNAVGPFCVMNANRTIEPGQWHILVIECQPMSQGLLTELLEIYCSDGGTRITLTLRVQGVNPMIDITGLEPYSSSSSSSSLSTSTPPLSLGGIVNFGHVIATDERSRKFTITNKSLFTVDIRIERAICAGILSSSKQSEVIQRTLHGLPIFSYHPERAVIPQGGSIEIEMIFRPDRARVAPFREDFNILVGKGDQPIQISSFGFVRSRQLGVRPVNPLDEPFINEMTIQDETDEDIFATHSSETIRHLTQELSLRHGVGITPQPIIKLSFPDPYQPKNDKDKDREGEEEGEGEEEEDDGVTLKVQMKQILISCLEFSESRQGSCPGSYELKLSEEAVKSKYFTIQNDKGNVSIGGEVILTIHCTLPRPKGLGGLEVGSWQIFPSQLLLKGGWKPLGEESDVVVPILLSAYVRL